MAEFHGYRCDSCGTVIEDQADRTIKRVRFNGPVLSGDYTQDLCRECIPTPDDLPDLRPIPRRRSRKQRAQQEEATA